MNSEGLGNQPALDTGTGISARPPGQPGHTLTKHNGQHLGGFLLLLLGQFPPDHGLEQVPRLAVGQGVDLEDLGCVVGFFGMAILLHLPRAAQGCLQGRVVAPIRSNWHNQLVVTWCCGFEGRFLRGTGTGHHLHFHLFYVTLCLLDKNQMSTT